MILIREAMAKADVGDDVFGEHTGVFIWCGEAGNGFEEFGSHL